jgi:hypothetical protein
MIATISACTEVKIHFPAPPWSLFHSSPEQTKQIRDTIYIYIYDTEAFSKVCKLWWRIIQKTLPYLLAQLPHFFTKSFCIKTRMGLLHSLFPFVKCKCYIRIKSTSNVFFKYFLVFFSENYIIHILTLLHSAGFSLLGLQTLRPILTYEYLPLNLWNFTTKKY